MGKRVKFLICGTQKGGTTALADYLREHPNLFIPKQKELHFFDNEERDWSQTSYDDYHLNFLDAKEACLCGEATPIYMYWDTSAKRIWEYNPCMKIIVILRNPISRAYSHWAMESYRGVESLSFEKAIRCEEQRCNESLPLQHRVFSYVDRGYYSNQLRRLWRFFGRESVLILKQEKLIVKPQECLDEVCMHLGIEKFESLKALISHPGKYPEPISKEAKNLLRKKFWHEICQLEALLGWDCHEWLRA